MLSKKFRISTWIILTIVSFCLIYESVVRTFPGDIRLAIGMLMASVYSMFNFAIGHRIIGYIFVIITIIYGIDFLI